MGETERPALDGTWRIVEVEGIDISRQRALSLYFDGTHLYGVAPCKTFTSTLTFDKVEKPGRFSMGRITRTPHLCDEATMVVDRTYIDAVSMLNGFRFDASGDLVLSSSGKPKLRARRLDNE